MEERKLCLFLKRKDVAPQNGVWWQREQSRAHTVAGMGRVLARNGSLGLGTWCPWGLVAALTQILVLRERSLPPHLDIRFLWLRLVLGICQPQGGTKLAPLVWGSEPCPGDFALGTNSSSFCFHLGCGSLGSVGLPLHSLLICGQNAVTQPAGSDTALGPGQAP